MLLVTVVVSELLLERLLLILHSNAALGKGMFLVLTKRNVVFKRLSAVLQPLLSTGKKR